MCTYWCTSKLLHAALAQASKSLSLPTWPVPIICDCGYPPAEGLVPYASACLSVAYCCSIRLPARHFVCSHWVVARYDPSCQFVQHRHVRSCSPGLFFCTSVDKCAKLDCWCTLLRGCCWAALLPGCFSLFFKGVKASLVHHCLPANAVPLCTPSFCLMRSVMPRLRGRCRPFCARAVLLLACVFQRRATSLVAFFASLVLITKLTNISANPRRVRPHYLALEDGYGTSHLLLLVWPSGFCTTAHALQAR